MLSERSWLKKSLGKSHEYHETCTVTSELLALTDRPYYLLACV
jgi:hypothetical protein